MTCRLELCPTVTHNTEMLKLLFRNCRWAKLVSLMNSLCHIVLELVSGEEDHMNMASVSLNVSTDVHRAPFSLTVLKILQ